MPERHCSNTRPDSTALPFIVAILLGCGDGVGRPIQQAQVPWNDLATAGSRATAQAGESGHSSHSRAANAGTSWSSNENAGTGSVAGTAASACSGVADWDPSWAAAEDELLLAINLARAAAFDCLTGNSVTVPPPQLKSSPTLRCSARRHSASRHTLGSAESRLALADASGAHVGAVVATTDQTNSEPAFVLIWWLLGDSAIDCTSLTDPSFTSAGVGFAYLDDTGYWTVDLGGSEHE
jgi:hypothetical protein